MLITRFSYLSTLNFKLYVDENDDVTQNLRKELEIKTIIFYGLINNIQCDDNTYYSHSSKGGTFG
jgi:hypothetical protein